MKRRFSKMIFIGHFRHRKTSLVLAGFCCYIFILILIAPDKSFPEVSVDRHPIYEAGNVTEFKEKNNLKLILVWTRLQVKQKLLFNICNNIFFFVNIRQKQQDLNVSRVQTLDPTSVSFHNIDCSQKLFLCIFFLGPS